MRKEAGAAAPAVRGWQSHVLDDVNRRLLASLWTRETLLRGSMARGSADSESDIDLVAVTADAEFETALRDLTSELPQFLPGRLPPWLDGIVRDFGGMGFVYLLRISEQKWGQLDIYLLPQSRKQQLLDNEFALALQCDGGIKPFAGQAATPVDSARRHFEEHAGADVEQAVLACYVAMFLLRKRLIRGDRLQTFADTYATALRVRDLIFAACYADRPERGWRDVPNAAERSPDRDLILSVMATFAHQDVVDAAALAHRAVGLEQIVAAVAPAVWRAHGEALRSLGRYLGGGADRPQS
ncbi:MAG: nucleotidyltransferase domain-containing protein [Xanthobacteraceae bacterium]|jgi:hypothetical protein